jgi:hypothetical protein
MTQDEQERQFLADAVVAAEKARSILIKEASAGGKVVDFTELRQLDMDIKKCKDELGRKA